MSSVVPPAPARTPLARGNHSRRHRAPARRRRDVRVLQGRHRGGRRSRRVRPALGALVRHVRAGSRVSSCPSSRSSGGPSPTAGRSTQGSQPGRPQGRVARRDDARARRCSASPSSARSWPAPTSTATGSWCSRWPWPSSGTRRPTSHAASARERGRFSEYAVIMGSDGVVRIILCIVLAARRHHRRRRVRAW